MLSHGLPEHLCSAMDRISGGIFSKEMGQMANGFYYDVPNNDMPTVIFLFCFMVLFVFYVLTILRTERVERQKGTEKYALFWGCFFAVIFRLMVLPSELIHENDIYRYLWDGKVFKNGINPYKYAPADLFMYEKGMTEDYYDPYWEVILKHKVFHAEDQKRLDRLIQLRDENPTFYQRIGHWEVPTIYPPLAEGIFLLSSYLREDSILFMKTIFVFFDLGVVVLIIFLLKHFQLNPLYSLVYSWSPLVVKEIPNSGHYDSIAIFLTLLAILVFLEHHRLMGTAFLALATLTKFFSVILPPIFIRPIKIKHISFFACILAIAYIPFIVWDQAGGRGVFEGLMTYNQYWSYNSSIFALLYWMSDHYWPFMTGSLFPTKVVCGVLYLFSLFYIFMRKENALGKIHQCLWALGGLFLLSPVGDPWYFCWTIPFLCFFRYRSWILLSGLLALSYLNFHSDMAIVNREFFHIPFTSWVIYIPFYLVLTWEIIIHPSYVRGPS